MILPQSVRECIDALESAGFAAYAVGGCVRDALLGLTPSDYDLCTPALPDQIETVFASRPTVLAGKKHGTVGIVTDIGVVEITTFRTEGGYRDSRHPDWVRFVADIAQDLARRDFTVNAMAYSPTRGFVDPFGGQHDLQNGILRAVGEPAARFREDALRILRGVRFSVKYRLTPEDATWQAMTELAHLTDLLARERVFDELCKLLPLVSAEDLLRFAPILSCAIPELAPTVGFDQHSPHHAYDLFTHIAHVTAATEPTLPLRWAGLLHDIGKVRAFTTDETGRGHFYGHAKIGAEMADAILLRLKAPTLLRTRVTTLIAQHMTKIEPEKRAVRRALSRLGKPMLEDLLKLQQADMSSKGTGIGAEFAQFSEITALIAQIESENACLTRKDLAVNGNDLVALGFSGRQIALTLEALLSEVLDERIPNEKQALLDAALTHRRHFL